MTELTIDGEVFRVEVEGSPDRPTVLLSSSLGADLSMWDAQMPALLEHFRVVRYDPRGHGRSTTAGAPYSLARLGADALGILDALAIETAHFIGISMGGAVGQWLLVNAPERIARAVLANTTARFGTPEVWNERIAAVLLQGTKSLVAATMERWFSDGFRRAEPGRVTPVEAAFRATSSEGYAGCCAALRDMDLREALHGVERPVLLVTGRDDPVTGEADIAAMTGALPGAQHVMLDCKHISNIEAEAAFNAAVVKFLTGRIPTRLARSRPARKLAASVRRPASRRATTARRPLEAARPKSSTPVTRAGARTTTAKATPTKTTPTKTTTAKPGARRSPTGKRSVSAAPVAPGKSSPKKSAPTKRAATRPAATKPAPTKAATTKAATTKPATTKSATTKKSSPPRKGIRAATPTKRVAKAPAAKKAAPRTAAAKTTSSARRRPTKTPGRPGGRRKR